MMLNDSQEGLSPTPMALIFKIVWHFHRASLYSIVEDNEMANGETKYKKREI